MYDLVIINARIVDGTGCPSYHGEVAVKDGKIAAVGIRLNQAGANVIDAKGHVVAPGFIDSHSHSDLIVEEYPECIGALEQGITTQVGGMCGESPAPLSAERLDETLRVIGALSGDVRGGADRRFSFGSYLDYIDKPLGTNMAFITGHGNIRACVMGYENRKATPEELEKMKALLADTMDGGSLGISFGLIYPPCSYCDTDEMAELCKVVASRGGVMTVHMRSENHRLVEALEEMLDVTRRSGVRCVISHHKATGGPANWGKTYRTIELIERANLEGLDVFCDQYPYTASSTGLNTNIPGELFALGVPAMMDMLASPEKRAELRKRIVGEGTSEQRFQYTMIGHSKSHPQFNGMMLNDAAKSLGVDPYELQCDLLLADNLSTGAIFHTMSEDDLKNVMRYKRTMVGTDGLWHPGSEGGHPRGIGTYPRVLGRYVRQQQVIPLEEAVRKMTSMPAAVYSLDLKGLVKTGFDADLVIFDPDTIIDNADYGAKFRERCTGLDYVFVGGKIAVRDSVFTGETGGKIIRRKM